ncbi:hypothetical protein MJI95_38065, partial [Salmonella enterica subsp. enterica serovar Kentucky]|nr:hypothetical protein [Salmonella enterica subsp. enterica serovar Kentucky]
TTSPLVSPEKAIELLGTMQGGYNIHPLIDALDDAKLAPIAANFISAKVSSRACCPTAKIIFSASSVSSPEWRTWWKVTLFPLTA